MLFIYTLLILLTLYGIIVIWYGLGWIKIPVYQPSIVNPSLKISVIIPARNEEKNIGQLLTALKNQDYPAELFEIIVVDDHSSDNTAAVVKNFPGVLLMSLNEANLNSYKKKAIETGIAAATGEMILATDADCMPTHEWIRQMACFAEENKAVFAAAPVVMNNDSSLLQVFQTMDFMVLQGITGAVVNSKKMSMCNGANIAYKKEAFYSVDGFSGIDDIASGDDMLLMYKIWKQFPEGVRYLKSKEAIVSTQPQMTWKSFFNQRIRWASKAAKYDDKRLFPVLLLVYLFNFSLFALFIAAFIHPFYWKWLLICWVTKTLVELPLFVSTARFFNKQRVIKWFFFFQPLHIAYTIAAGLFGQLGKYEWKGRRVK